MPTDQPITREQVEESVAMRAAKAMFPNEPSRQPGAAQIIQTLIDDAVKADRVAADFRRRK